MRIIILFLVCNLLISCSYVTNVSYDYDVEYEFASIKTFSWFSQPEEIGDGIKLPNPIMEKILKSRRHNPHIEEYLEKFITHSLIAKGYQQQAQNPDILLDYDISFINKTSEQTNTEVREDYQFHYNTPTYTSYTECTVRLDFFDGVSRQIIWRGRASGAMDSTPNQQIAQDFIAQAIHKLLANFPPGDQ